MSHDNKPLTLEELRKMNNVPVWIENLEDPAKSQWRLLHWDRGKYLVLQGISLQGYLLEEYGESWLAYAQKPIDWEVWEPCPYCIQCDSCVFGRYYYPNSCNACESKSKYEPAANFCECCGRPLTDKARELLERRLAHEHNE